MAGRARREHNGSIRALPSGRYQVRLRVPHSLPPDYYPDPNGTYATKAAASKSLRMHNAAIDAGTWRHPDELAAEAIEAEARSVVEAVTVAEMCDRWIESKRADGISAGSIVTYRSRLDVSVLPTFGTRRVVDVTSADVDEWFAKLDADSRHRASLAYDRLVAVMRFAVESGVIVESPCQVPAKRRASTRSTGERGTLVPDDVMRAVANAIEGPERLVPLLAGWCGLREGEALGLSSSALVEDDGVLFLDISVQATAKGPRGLAAPKSRAGRRSVPVPSWLAVLVRERADAAQGLLFPSPRDPSLPLSRSAWDRRFANAVQAVRSAGGAVPDGVRLHDFRHTALTRFSRAGATAEDLRRFGGHSDDATSRVYQHSEARRLAEIMERASRSVAPASP